MENVIKANAFNDGFKKQNDEITVVNAIIPQRISLLKN